MKSLEEHEGAAAAAVAAGVSARHPSVSEIKWARQQSCGARRFSPTSVGLFWGSPTSWFHNARTGLSSKSSLERRVEEGGRGDIDLSVEEGAVCNRSIEFHQLSPPRVNIRLNLPSLVFVFSQNDTSFRVSEKRGYYEKTHTGTMRT